MRQFGEALTPSAYTEGNKLAIKDVRARASLISDILQAGGCPNTEMVCVVRKLKISDTLSGPQHVHERLVTK